MPPFNQNSPSSNFHKDDPQFTKVGKLEDDPSTLEEVENIKSKIKSLEEELRLFQKKLSAFTGKGYNDGYMLASDLYQTSEGSLVASLPRHHPVMQRIAKQEFIERLKMGMQNLIQALNEEIKHRSPVNWLDESVSDKIPEDVRDLIVDGNGKSLHNSWESRVDENTLNKWAQYVMVLFPDLFQDREKIKQINFCNEFDSEMRTGFSGVAVSYDNNLYLITKDGERIMLVDTDTYKTYPCITKNGPDFRGYGKTQHGRFSFGNYEFKGQSSSGVIDFDITEKITPERIQEMLDAGEVLRGIDAETYYDKDTKCIVIKGPEFNKPSR